CLPGRGWTRVKYDADLGEHPAKDEGGEPTPYTKSELVCTNIVSWKRGFHGYARTWSAVPWVAYEYDIDRQEAEKKFEKEIIAKLTFTDDVDEKEKDKEEQHRGEKKTVRIVEIWDK